MAVGCEQRPNSIPRRNPKGGIGCGRKLRHSRQNRASAVTGRVTFFRPRYEAPKYISAPAAISRGPMKSVLISIHPANFPGTVSLDDTNPATIIESDCLIAALRFRQERQWWVTGIGQAAIG